MLLPHLIRTRLGKGSDFLRKASAGVLVIRRWLVQMLRGSDEQSRILFIFGCQRSGTTLLSRIFEGDPMVCSYSEHSNSLTRPDHELRMRSLPELEGIFNKCRGHLIVAKPLVESQRAIEFLQYFPSAHAVWSFRHYREVVRSFVKLFDRAGVNIMKKIIDQEDNWASEMVSDESRELVERFFAEDMPVNDAAAIFWLLRNQLYFDQKLDQNPWVMTCYYGDLVSKPDETVSSIYNFLEIEYPGSHLVGGVHEDSRGKGSSLVLDPEIESLCEQMMTRLMGSDREATQLATDSAAV